MNFKLTWAWGKSKLFPDRRTMNQWRSQHEDQIEGMYAPREYVLGVDGNWYELAQDFCRECGYTS